MHPEHKHILYTNSSWLTRFHKVQVCAERGHKLEKEQVAEPLQSMWCAVCSHPGMPCSSLFVHLFLQAVESLFHLLLKLWLIGTSSLAIRNRKKIWKLAKFSLSTFLTKVYWSTFKVYERIRDFKIYNQRLYKKENREHHWEIKIWKCRLSSICLM